MLPNVELLSRFAAYIRNNSTLDGKRKCKNTPCAQGVFLCMFGGVLLFHPIGQYHWR